MKMKKIYAIYKENNYGDDLIVAYVSSKKKAIAYCSSEAREEIIKGNGDRTGHYGKKITKVVDKDLDWNIYTFTNVLYFKAIDVE